jgi:hypothetical protein
MGEIHQYVEVLIASNHNYQDSLKAIQTENSHLWAKADQMAEEAAMTKESSGKEMVEMRAAFEADIEKLVREVKAILQEKEQMQVANAVVMEEIAARCRKDLEAKKSQIEEFEEESSRRVGRLSEALKNKERAIEELGRLAKEKEEETGRLVAQVSLLAKEKGELACQMDALNCEKRSLLKRQK